MRKAPKIVVTSRMARKIDPKILIKALGTEPPVRVRNKEEALQKYLEGRKRR